MAHLTTRSREAWTELCMAAKRGDIAKLERMIAAGHDINYYDKDWATGNTVLSEAARDKQLATVKFLLDKGADVNARDYWGQTALHRAVYSECKPVCELLVSRGADLTIKTNSDGSVGAINRDKTPAECARARGYTVLASWLEGAASSSSSAAPAPARARRTLVTSSVGAATSASSSSAASASAAAASSASSVDVAALRAELETVKKACAEAESARQGMESQKAAAEKARDAAVDALEDLKRRLEEARAAIADRERTIAEQEQAITDQAAVIARQAMGEL